MAFEIYLTEENAPAVAADTGWTITELLDLLQEDPGRRWRICISGIRAEPYGRTMDAKCTCEECRKARGENDGSYL